MCVCVSACARVCFSVLEGDVDDDDGEDLGFVEEFVGGLHTDDDMKGARVCFVRAHVCHVFVCIFISEYMIYFASGAYV